MKRINAWSSPRNISTAFMYSFAQREDTTVVDEPFYAHYLSKAKTEAKHPGDTEVLDSQDQDGQKVIEKIILGDYPTPVVLFKQMTHHLIELDWDFLSQTDNILLIRDPRAIIASYAKVIPNPTIDDIGVKKQLDLFNHLSSIGRLKAIIDSKQLLLNPEKVLTQLCNALGISFDKSMLNWQAGQRPEDGIWAKYWYANVHASSGFKPYKEKAIHLSEPLEVLAQICQPYYDKLFDQAIKA